MRTSDFAPVPTPDAKTPSDWLRSRVSVLTLTVPPPSCAFSGPMEGDAFAEFVTTNREPRVVALNDASFEHLTQASTGATTGDWLVML